MWAPRVLVSSALALAAWLGGAPASAQSLSTDPITARSIGHAGAGLVADDTAAVWWQNPAAAARREAARVMLGLSSVDTDLEITPHVGGAAPRSVSRASSGISPQLSLVVTWKGTSLGASMLYGQRLGRRFEGPPPRIAVEQANRVYSLRYAGLAGAIRRETYNLGAARRFTDELAVGLSVGVSRMSLRESRRLWAGLQSRAGNGDIVRDPQHDLELSILATDQLVPTATAGAVWVPEDSPLELAVSATAIAGFALRGELSGRPTETSTALAAGDRRAALDLPAQLVVRGGARWQGERWSVEANGQLELVPARARQLTWQLEDVVVRDYSGLTAPIHQLRSQLSLRSLASLRAAADVELIEGFLWLSGGAAWSPILPSGPRLSPGFAELGGGTAALGAEISSGGVTVALGISRTWSPEVATSFSLHRLDNPFGSGDGRTGNGTYQAAVDLIGASIEVEL
jgi:Outer membrane protein transport protein (OMPP1/FadL/TodX)